MFYVLQAENLKQLNQDAGWMHDLRTIASTLLTHADVFALSRCSREEFLDSIRANCSMLLTLTDALASERWAGDGGVNSGTASRPRDPSVGTIIESVVDAFRLGASAINCQLTTKIEDGLPSISRSESVTIQRILSNLISNSIRHSRASKIIIRASTVKVLEGGSANNQSSVLLEVQDWGIGLNEEQIKALTSSSGSGKPGKGLATVGRLVLSIKGQLSIESNSNDGTKVSLRFSTGSKALLNECDADRIRYPNGVLVRSDLEGPLARRQAMMDTQAATSLAEHLAMGSKEGLRNGLTQTQDSFRSPQPRVLLVDDDPQMAELLRVLLAERELQIIAVEDEQSAKAYFQDRLDLVLVDLSLGNVDGCVVAEQMRCAGYRGKIFAFSAESPKYLSAARIKRIGVLFDGWIDKTAGGVEVATRINRILGELIAGTRK